MVVGKVIHEIDSAWLFNVGQLNLCGTFFTIRTFDLICARSALYFRSTKPFQVDSDSYMEFSLVAFVP